MHMIGHELRNFAIHFDPLPRALIGPYAPGDPRGQPPLPRFRRHNSMKGWSRYHEGPAQLIAPCLLLLLQCVQTASRRRR